MSGFVQDMPFRIVQMIYLTGLAIWVGGALVLGAVVAPLLFKRLPSRTEAGKIFGECLERFDFVCFVLVPVLIVCSAIRLLTGWEVWGEGPTRIKYLTLGLFFLLFIYIIAGVRPAMKQARAEIKDFDALPETDPKRMAFRRLHKKAGRLFGLQVLLGLFLLYLN